MNQPLTLAQARLVTEKKEAFGKNLFELSSNCKVECCERLSTFTLVMLSHLPVVNRLMSKVFPISVSIPKTQFKKVYIHRDLKVFHLHTTIPFICSKVLIYKNIYKRNEIRHNNKFDDVLWEEF
ncbi:CLUMA_CG011894, isoform A [Clunio marinus]|uniref:CLUMA_CG011894, isoform A n=1 Tax=Clunio marinus TaxID=568069 RepID=A0A1J1IE40_9DIPT|nr:CLUMA_CG011894, isoform A [Clunio marinus]